MRNRWAVRFLIVMITVVGLGTVGPMAPGQAPPNDQQGSTTNDEIDSATLVTEPFPFFDEVSTAAATAAPNDPSCVEHPLQRESHTVWYRYTPDHDILIEVRAAAQFDGMLSAYLDLEGELMQIACSDDPQLRDPRIDIAVGAGETVLFMVASHPDAGRGGDILFSVDLRRPGAGSSTREWGLGFWIAAAMFVTAAGATVVCLLKRRFAFGAAGIAASAFTALLALDLRETEPDMGLFNAFALIILLAVGSPLISLAVIGASKPAKPRSWWAKRKPPTADSPNQDQTN